MRADLGGAYLTKANIRNAVLGFTIFVNVDLREVQGLEEVKPVAGSEISISTIYRSCGNIPNEFMRSCGVPETMITFAKSLVGNPIEFFSCFISHSAKDQHFCNRFYADLQAKGIRIWYFPEDAKWRELIWGEIDRNIKVYDKLIVVCSENSLASGPVQREIERALQHEDNEGKNILFPIRIDDYIFTKWQHPRKADVVSKVIGDFSGWDTDAAKYEASLQKLLKALKAEDKK